MKMAKRRSITKNNSKGDDKIEVICATDGRVWHTDKTDADDVPVCLPLPLFLLLQTILVNDSISAHVRLNVLYYLMTKSDSSIVIGTIFLKPEK